MNEGKAFNKSSNNKTPIFKKWWFWLIVVVIIIAASSAGASQNNGNKANETTKTSDNSASKPKSESKPAAESKPALTLDDGWAIDQSNPYATYVNGYVSNNTDKAYNSYIQITFNAYDESGANVGTCLANTNTVDANGKWKFQAMCSGDNVKTVKFKDITGF
jgi:uncharacterized protein YxeA